MAQGGGAVENADNTLQNDFVSADFKASDELNDFKIEIFLKDKNGNEYACVGSINGRPYLQTLTPSGLQAAIQMVSRRN